jgi:ABC-type multidrug transport system fused ATPase/permease subunit
VALKNQLPSVPKATQLEDLVAALPQGIYANLGENGSRLSVGQRQRIEIARAIFTNPRLVVLD